MAGRSNGAATAVAKAPPKEIKTLLLEAEDRLRAVLPRHLTPEKMIQVVATLAFKTPKLQQCIPQTILTSVLEACELGLELSPKFGEAYLVPYWSKQANANICQLIPGYRGLAKLARNTGQVVYVQGRIVYEADLFTYEYDPDLVFKHRPCTGRDKGPVTDVYAVAKIAGDEHLIEVLTYDEVEAVRRRSKSANDGPWVTDWNEMAKKTAVKRLCKSLPSSPELARAIELDDAQYEDGPTVTVSAPPLPRGLSRSERLAAQLAGPTVDESEPMTETPAEPADDGEEWEDDRE